MARKRQKRTVDRELLPDAIYNRDGLWRFAGIGKALLKEMRLAGLRPSGGATGLYFRGDEVIGWKESWVYLRAILMGSHACVHDRQQLHFDENSGPRFGDAMIRTFFAAL